MNEIVKCNTPMFIDCTKILDCPILCRWFYVRIIECVFTLKTMLLLLNEGFSAVNGQRKPYYELRDSKGERTQVISYLNFFALRCFKHSPRYCWLRHRWWSPTKLRQLLMVITPSECYGASTFFFNRVIAAVFYMKPRVIIETGMLLLLVLGRAVFLSLVDLLSEREARASGSQREFQKSLRYPTVCVLKSSWNTTPYSQSQSSKFWRRIECKIGCTRDGISDSNKWPGSCLYSECGRGVRGSTRDGILIAFFVFRRLVSRRFLERESETQVP